MIISIPSAFAQVTNSTSVEPFDSEFMFQQEEIPIQVNTGNSIILINSDCSVQINDYMNNVIFEDNGYTVRVAEYDSDNWVDLEVNDSVCNVYNYDNMESLEYNHGIKTVQENYEGVLTKYYDISNRDKTKVSIEFENKFYPNHKFMTYEHIVLSDPNITLNGEMYDLSDYVGQSFDRSVLDNYTDVLIGFNNNAVWYQSDIGFDNLWSVDMIDYNKINLNYGKTDTLTQIGEKYVLDPVIWGSSFGGTQNAVLKYTSSYWTGSGTSINTATKFDGSGTTYYYRDISGSDFNSQVAGDFTWVINKAFGTTYASQGVKVAFTNGDHIECNSTSSHAQLSLAFNRCGSGSGGDSTGTSSSQGSGSLTSDITVSRSGDNVTISFAGHTKSESGLTIDYIRHHEEKILNGNVHSSVYLTTYSLNAVPVTVPTAPQSLSIDTQDVANEITLNWLAPSDNGGASITAYKVYLGGSLIATTGNVLTYDDTISGGEIGSSLTYKVNAVNSAGDSPDSNTATITSWNVPDQVTGLSGTIGASPTLNWSAPSSDDTITNYKIYRQGVLHDTIGNVLTYSDSTNVSSGSTYTYTVSAVSAVGEGAQSSSVNVVAGVPADPPSNVQAVISDPNNSPLDVTVTYTTPSSVGTGTLTGFQLLRNGTAVSSVGLVNTISDTAPSGGNIFTYTVKSLSTHGTSSASSGSSVTTPNTPDQVTGLTVTPVSTSRIDLSWNTPSDNNSQISGYKVQISSNGGSSYTDILTGNVNTVYQALSLNTNAQYHFKVSAINAVGTGTASDVKNTYTMTPTPSSLTATPVSEVQINLAWGASTGSTGYKIEYESPVDDGFITLVNNTGTTDVTYSATGLTTATQYNFKVSGWNNGGTSQSSPEASAYTWGILQAPVIDSVSRLSPTSLKVDWTTGSGLPVATGYKIERQLGSGWTILANNTGTTDVTYTDSTLPEADQVASYRIYAINTIGTSLVSNEVSSEVVASGGGSSGGGGGSSGTAVSSQTGISALTDLTYIDQIHRVVLGQLLSKSINVAWDSSNNLEVKSIIVSDSPFRIVFQDVPFVLLGDQSGISNGKINYSVQIPNEFCTQQGQINCVEQRQYDIPVEIQTVHKGSTLTKTSVIKIDLTSSSDIPLVFVLLAIGAVPVAFILRKVGKGSSRRKASGSSRKSSKNGSNSKKVSL